jgi:hypothetical protein
MATKKRREVREHRERVATGATRAKVATGARVETGTTPDAASAGSTGPRTNFPDWRWRSFPVFAALVTGVLIDSLISPPSNTAGQVVRIAALASFGYCLAHLFVTNVVIAGRIKRRGKAIARGETPPEDFVEEAVYPENQAGS